jgi:hypothetical protein
MTSFLLLVESAVSEKINKFQPRSFNMGLSRKALKSPKALEIYILAKIRPIDTALEARF